MTLDLFARSASPASTPASIGPGAVVLHGFAGEGDEALLAAISEIFQAAPPRQLSTPSGLAMSVRSTNCGTWGWISDRAGYRYQATDPMTGLPWPPLPPALLALATRAAAAAGFADFVPDACLLNRYDIGAKMGLHQDRDELDLTAPIVSVSLGLPAVFQFGGAERSERPRRVRLEHGDVVVWGGPSRLHYHGVSPIKPGAHPRLGAQRINLTFRKAR